MSRKPDRHAGADILTPLGFGRGRLGAAPGNKAMEQEMAARAPLVGEGSQSKGDAWLGKTVQPDHLAQLPPEFLIDHHRAGAAAIGVAVQRLADRVPEQEALLAEHLELSYDGEVLVGHGAIDRQLSQGWWTAVVLGVGVVGVGAIAALAFLMGWVALDQITQRDEHIRQLQQEIELLGREIERQRGAP